MGNRKDWLLDDYGSALLQLEEALATPASRDLEKAGCIQYFEFCFELAWKAVRNHAESQGVEPCLTPKACLKTAFFLGWIHDEAIWLDMLESRNKMSHTYDARRALAIYTKLPGYRDALRALNMALRTDTG